MPFPPLDPAILAKAVAAYEEHGHSKTKAAQSMGVSRETFSYWLNKANGVKRKTYHPKSPISQDRPTRIFIIPDTQVRHGVPVDHIPWIARAIIEYKPDVIIHLGDHWDMKSLSQYDQPGSLELEGSRIRDDLEAGNKSFAELSSPVEKEIERLRGKWKPRMVFLMGNHEIRADRIARNDARWHEFISSDHCITRNWERHGFLERVFIENICFSHYFQNQGSKHAIGGSIDNRLNKIGCSFVQGHEQGFRYGTRITGSGSTWHGLVAGSCYLHVENYRGAQGQKHWRGVVVLNEVKNGSYDIMPLSLSYLCRKYSGLELRAYMDNRYSGGDWRHLE